MTGLFKCLVLSCVVSVIFAFTSVRDDANWFKIDQRIKNRFVTGVVNGIVDFNCNNTENVEGECLPKVECTKSGGKLGGLCSLMGSCCVVEKTCSQTTSSKISYFVRPEHLKPDCPLTVNIYSEYVCQIRLDFEKFDIAQPTSRKENLKNEKNDTVYTSYQCYDDLFRVENVKKNLMFPHLCGKNAGQHIYIPIAENQEQIVLRFKFQDITWKNSIQADWRIKIKQLECPKSGYQHFLNAPSKLMAMHNNLKNKKQPNPDWKLIAPPNCLQYYFKKTGTFESFNYNDGKGPYIGGLNYAICFEKNYQKATEICGAKYTAAGIFQMNFNVLAFGNNKCHPTKPADAKTSQDYIQISQGVNSENNFTDFYCSSDLTDYNYTIAKSYEPLYVGVHTDQFLANKDNDEPEKDIFQEIGFRIKYELLSGGDC